METRREGKTGENVCEERKNVCCYRALIVETGLFSVDANEGTMPQRKAVASKAPKEKQEKIPRKKAARNDQEEQS